ncbi:MAG: carboxylesterase family protein, partial [Promethearchaeota archaeon]
PNASKLTLDRINNRVKKLMDFYNQAEEKTKSFIETYIQEREQNNFSLIPRDIYDNIASDLWFRILSIRLAEAQSKFRDVYMYLFTWKSPALRGKLGASHAVELPFVFGTLNVPRMDIFAGKGPAAEKLSEQIMDSWINFAKTGNPNHNGIPEWHPFNTKTRATMFLGKEIKLVNDPFERTRIVWDGIF